jgi:hypothetical protein
MGVATLFPHRHEPREVLSQARSAGYDVLEAMERAERVHVDYVAAQELVGGRRCKLLQRLGSGGSSSGCDPQQQTTSFKTKVRECTEETPPLSRMETPGC